MNTTFGSTSWITANPSHESRHWGERIIVALVFSLALLLEGCGGGGSRTTTSSLTPPPAPTVSNISPASGPRAGGTRVTITGTGFVSGATVSIGGSACSSPVVASETQITCTTGRGTGGKADVAVTNPSGATGVLSSGFTYLLVLFVDGNGPNGLNKDVSQNADAPKVVAFAGKLYVAWVENGGTTSVPQIRVSAYNADDSPPVWSRVDGGGAFGINKDRTKAATGPTLVVFQGQLYAAWVERSSATNASQIRVALYNGNDSAAVWRFVDLDGVNGINKNAANNAFSPQLAVFNSKLYATWSEADNGSIQQIRAAVYNGLESAPAWTFVDRNSPTAGLNKNPAKNAGEPFLIDFNSKLYCAWGEVGTSVYRIRFAAYNGDDGAPAWQFVDGNGADGLGKSPAADAIAPTLAIYNSKLYATWLEDQDFRTVQLRAVVNDGTDSWSFVDGNGTNGINHDPTQFADPAALIVFGSSLYAAWDEGFGFPPFVNQIRLAAYNGNDSSPEWPFADGNSSIGVNRDASKNASGVQLAVLNSKLYLVWQEDNVNSKSQVRVATLQ